MDCREVKFKNGYKGLIDEEDFDLISCRKWHLVGRGDYQYAASGYQMSKKRIAAGCSPINTRVYMHRIIVGAKDGEFVDHINGNTLDNRKSNLRICSHAENMQNRKPNLNRQYRGVFTHPNSKSTFYAKIKNRHLGTFQSDVEAALAYDFAAVREFGEFARLNFPELITNKPNNIQKENA